MDLTDLCCENKTLTYLKHKTAQYIKITEILQMCKLRLYILQRLVITECF